jgi:glycerol-3-phosphate dehydrogenase
VTGPGSAIRPQNLDRLRHRSLDILVIGGGITGSGIALDAASRGLIVGLIDKGDFASGTSSASSKLIHGGLRYLEHGEFGLVREALRERHTLLRIAPHLVRPIRLVVPHYSGTRRPRWLIKLGLTLYDWLAGRERIGRHRPVVVRELVSMVPGLRTEGLRGGFEFYDAQMDDARLCLEVVLTSMALGAAAANYVEAVEMRRDGAGRISGCNVVDRLSGEHFGISARQIVNAAGPWLDDVGRIDDAASEPMLSPTKGVHVVLPDIGLDVGLLVTHPADGRVMFILPWMHRTLVGTTDTFFDAEPEEARADAADTDYLLAAASHYCGRAFGRGDVTATLVGLRPLLHAKGTGPSAVSREFTIRRSKSGMWSIAGGKYTTYRSMAEKLVDQLIAERDGSRAESPSRTAQQRLLGAPDGDWATFRDRERQALQAEFALDSMLADHLVGRYGVRARPLVEEFGKDSQLWRPIAEGEPDVWAEFRYQAKYELAELPADHLLRRTRLGLFHPSLLAGSVDPHVAAGQFGVFTKK